jgi:hypothetical protein
MVVRVGYELWGCFAVQAQMDGQAAKQKEALYKAALQELTLFKSRTSAALLQVLPCGSPSTQTRITSVQVLVHVRFLP